MSDGGSPGEGTVTAAAAAAAAMSTTTTTTRREEGDGVGCSGGDEKKDENEDCVPPPERVVPQLASHGVTESDLRTAARVLEAVASLNAGSKKGGRKKKNKKRRREGEVGAKARSGGEEASGEGEENEDDDEEEEQEQEEDDGLARYRHKNLRPLRKALAGCFELHRRVLFNGRAEEDHYRERAAERTLKRQKMAERRRQREYIAKTQLRRGRIERLEKLKEDAREEVVGKLRMLVPDGHVDTMEIEGGEPAPLLLKGAPEVGDDDDGAEKPAGDADGAKLGDVDAVGDEDEEKKDSVNLPKLRSCYVCKVRYRELHHFYDQLCPPCASLNYAKRHFSVPLDGKVAVVTGSRVKIGYQTCLKLLRAGCEVVATTRFPNAAAAAYRREKDFDRWRGRLHVFGLDLRDVAGIEAFARFLKVRYGDTGIDILINNACQTVRRPGGYYRPLVDKEREIWEKADDAHRSVLGGCVEFERIRRKLVVDQSRGAGGGAAARAERGKEDVPLLQVGLDHAAESNGPAAAAAADSSGKKQPPDEARPAPPAGGELAPASASRSAVIVVPFESTGLSHSAAMTQMVVLPEDVGASPDVLPPGASDVNGQQVDLRSRNSWLLRMDEVSTPEVMECMLINAIAPFVLNGRLRHLLTTPNDDDGSRPDRYIVNVSAMEGKFYRYKTPNHPHTNMAKAALNMLTRTSSEELAKRHRVYMNSVDTGWINDENPLEKASRIARTNVFQTPIDEIDAAARVLDPVFVGAAADRERAAAGGGGGSAERPEKEYGKFYKDYRETEW